jgi:hypothetical protein
MVEDAAPVGLATIAAGGAIVETEVGVDTGGKFVGTFVGLTSDGTAAGGTFGDGAAHPTVRPSVARPKRDMNLKLTRKLNIIRY